MARPAAKVAYPVETVPFRYLPDCHGKEPFSSWTLALKVAKKLSRRHESDRFQAYRCRFCGGWHVGSRL